MTCHYHCDEWRLGKALIFSPDGNILEGMVIYSNLWVSGKAVCIKLNPVDLESSHMAENEF